MTADATDFRRRAERATSEMAALSAQADKLKADFRELNKRANKLNADIGAIDVATDEMKALNDRFRSPPTGDPDHEWDTRDEPTSRIHWTVEQSDRGVVS